MELGSFQREGGRIGQMDEEKMRFEGGGYEDEERGKGMDRFHICILVWIEWA